MKNCLYISTASSSHSSQTSIKRKGSASEEDTGDDESTHYRDVVRFQQLFSQGGREQQRMVMELAFQILDPAQQAQQDAQLPHP